MPPHVLRLTWSCIRLAVLCSWCGRCAAEIQDRSPVTSSGEDKKQLTSSVKSPETHQVTSPSTTSYPNKNELSSSPIPRTDTVPPVLPTAQGRMISTESSTAATSEHNIQDHEEYAMTTGGASASASQEDHDQAPKKRQHISSSSLPRATSHVEDSNVNPHPPEVSMAMGDVLQQSPTNHQQMKMSTGTVHREASKATSELETQASVVAAIRSRVMGSGTTTTAAAAADETLTMAYVQNKLVPALHTAVMYSIVCGAFYHTPILAWAYSKSPPGDQHTNRLKILPLDDNDPNFKEVKRRIPIPPNANLQLVGDAPAAPASGRVPYPGVGEGRVIEGYSSTIEVAESEGTSWNYLLTQKIKTAAGDVAGGVEQTYTVKSKLNILVPEPILQGTQTDQKFHLINMQMLELSHAPVEEQQQFGWKPLLLSGPQAAGPRFNNIGTLQPRSNLM
ncbi:unnamed protein product [Amoebophrya sp. A120]|nr:unnamed protein product [Amoebophrya sp. A120]|eukprot:GSA120T00017300001.1